MSEEDDFLLCCKNGDVVSVKELILRDASLVKAKSEGSEETGLHLAASFGHIAIVKLLIESGAEINCEDYYHNTPLAAAVGAHRNEITDYLSQMGGKVFN